MQNVKQILCKFLSFNLADRNPVQQRWPICIWNPFKFQYQPIIDSLQALHAQSKWYVTFSIHCQWCYNTIRRRVRFWKTEQVHTWLFSFRCIRFQRGSDFSWRSIPFFSVGMLFTQDGGNLQYGGRNVRCKVWWTLCAYVIRVMSYFSKFWNYILFKSNLLISTRMKANNKLLKWLLVKMIFKLNWRLNYDFLTISRQFWVDKCSNQSAVETKNFMNAKYRCTMNHLNKIRFLYFSL